MLTVTRPLFGLFLCLVTLRLAAAAPDIYSISGIAVDTTAESAVVAQQQALETAEREGLRQLLERLVVEEDQGLLPDIETITLDPFVRSYTIEEEKRSATRYIAKVTVRYEPRAVRALLADAGARAVIAPSPPLLVVPVLLRNGTVDLWSEDNPWRAAWLANADRNTFLTILLPLGDLADIVALGDASPETNAEGLAKLADRYGTRDVVVVRAALLPVPEAATERQPETRLALALVPAGGWFTEPAEEMVALSPGEKEARIWERGVARAKALLERVWKRNNAVRLGSRDTLRVTVPLADLRSWVQIRQKLEAMPEIRSLRVERLSRRQAELSIAFIGDRTQLQQALAGRGLDLVLEDGSWQLRPVVGPDEPSAPSSASPPAL